MRALSKDMILCSQRTLLAVNAIENAHVEGLQTVRRMAAHETGAVIGEAIAKALGQAGEATDKYKAAMQAHAAECVRESIKALKQELRDEVLAEVRATLAEDQKLRATAAQEATARLDKELSMRLAVDDLPMPKSSVRRQREK